MNFLKRTILILSLTYLFTFVIAEKVYTDEFAVHIRGGRSVADELAAKYGYVNKGQIGELTDHYLFHHNKVHRRSVLPSEGQHTLLENEQMVEWMEQQHIKKRVKRDFVDESRRATPELSDRLAPLQRGLQNKDRKPVKDAKLFSDLEYKGQWYISRSKAPTMNVEEAWKLGATGEGVVVSILDDGIELGHPDLKLNYDQQASYDFNGRRKNPAPRYDFANTNGHGTRCAGEVAMQADNGVCGVGIAFNASIGGVRMLDGDVTDEVEASSLSHARRHIDVYSASWGPDDDGRTVDGPGPLAKKAFIQGINEGRHGLGSIYVWASGNGGRYGDSCNCDGYANSIYTLSISSTSERGKAPWYLETCASTLASTYSSGAKDEKKVVTTDLHGGCTSAHTGTSASAPIAAGVIALALQANPNLSWRDVQYLVVRTSRRENLEADDWALNGAGYAVSHKYGFGLMDAQAMVQQAKSWRTLPEQHVCEIQGITAPRKLQGSNILRLAVNTNASACGQSVRYLEHVQAQLTLTFSQRGALVIRLISPMNTVSTILQARHGDMRPGGFSEWSFMSTHYWGEESDGTWILEVESTGLQTNSGKITQFNLILYGTEDPPEFQRHPKTRSNNEEDTGADERFDDWNDPSWEDDYDDWDSFSSSYDDSNCHEECWDTGCDGSEAKDCFKCKHFRDRETENCVQFCPAGQYEPTYLHERCKYCHQECVECIGSRAWDCTACRDGEFLMDGECLDRCDDGYFADGGDNVCHRCDDLCTLCKDAPDNCQACVAGAVLDDNECRYSCPTSYYLENGQCQPCDRSCETCHGPEAYDCMSCKPDKVHREQYCVDVGQCGEGWYISDNTHLGEEDRECIECHLSCETCDGFSYNNCLSCTDGYILSFGVCEPDCPDGTYKNPGTGLCDDCPDSCSLCISEHICVACKDQKVLHQGQCDEGCTVRFYEYAGECFQCHDLCETCSDGGLTDCTDCRQENGDRYLLEGACLPFCPEGYFMDVETHLCKDCDETCRRCDVNQCIECMDENVLPGSGEWVCGEDEHAEACESMCKTCVPGEPDQCLTCQSDLYMHNYECISHCPDGYFKDEQRQSCRRCHPTCYTCSGFHKHDCLSCDAEYVLSRDGTSEKFECKTHCTNSTYEDVQEDDNSRICQPCHEDCKTCDSSTENDCISCDSHKFLQVNWQQDIEMPIRNCVTDCEDGTFGAPDDGECLPCHASCATCTNDPNHCTACEVGYELDGLTCRNRKGCRDDQFTNDDDQCENCDYTCETCDGAGATQCLSCDYYRFLSHENRCVEVCPNDYYQDFDLNLCLPCHETCDGCVMGGPSDCLDCKDDLYSFPYDGQSCVTSCPEGFYEMTEGQGRIQTCQQCSPECRDCHDSYWQCISCDDDTYLFQERCVSACPFDYREDATTNHCVLEDDVRFPCPLHCEECDDWGDCRTCETGYERYYGECVMRDEQTCEDGEYPSIDEDDVVRCLSCHDSCAKCQGPLAEECLSCKLAGHQLSRGSCQLQCAENMYSHTEDDNGKPKDVCLACHPTCKSCSGPAPNQCKSCDETKEMLYDEEHNSCHVNCPSHTVFRNGGCEHCHDSCGTCNGVSKNHCLTCSNGRYHMEFENGSNACVQTCQNGTFHYRPDETSTDNYECQQCHASCKTCYGETFYMCTSCPAVMKRQDLQCVTTCDEGYYPDEENICQRCHDSCETCFGVNKNHCMSCSHDLYLQDNNCVDECPPHWYEQPGHKCGECHSRCKECSAEGVFGCTLCHSSYILTNNTCYNRCTKGDYWINGTCTDCDVTCLECYGPSNTHCIDCPDGLLLKRIDATHASCVNCCSDKEDPEKDDCCKCNDERDKCMKSGKGKGKGKGKGNKNANDASSHGKDHKGTIVLGTIIAVACFFTIFCLLQARSKKKWCFADSYDRLPAYYDNKGNHVIMSKQYQHEKINVMSDDEDFYEDIDSEEETD